MDIGKAFQFYFNVLLLRTEAFEEIKQAANGFQRVLVMVLLVTLIGGLSSCSLAFQSPLTVDQAEQQIEQMRETFEQFGLEGEFLEQQMTQTETQLRVQAAIFENVRPPVGWRVSYIIQAFGAWLGAPIIWLAGFFFNALFVLLIARLLGGPGSLGDHMKLTALSAAPQALTLLAWVPCLGGLLGFVAWIWGILIYIKGIDTAHEFGTGKSVVAWIAPSVIYAVLFGALLLALFVLVFAIGLAAGG